MGSEFSFPFPSHSHKISVGIPIGLYVFTMYTVYIRCSDNEFSDILDIVNYWI